MANEVQLLEGAEWSVQVIVGNSRCATLHQPQLSLKLPTRSSAANSEGEDEISEEILLELDLPSFDRLRFAIAQAISGLSELKL